MHLADQAGTDRQLLKSLKTPPHRLNVVDDFLNIGVGGLAARLGFQDFGKARLGPLDPGRGKGLSKQIRPNQQIRVWQQTTHARQLAERALGFCQEADGRPR